MDGSQDIEIEEKPTLKTIPRGKEDLEDIFIALGGFGNYQKRLFCLLVVFLFAAIPLLQNTQAFTLHTPNHKCLPGDQLPTYREMNLTREEWDWVSLKTDKHWKVGSTVWGAPLSTCKFFGFTKEQLKKIKTIVQKNPSYDRLEGISDVQDEAVDLACTKWEYDKSESKMETLVTQNNWVCGKASVVADLYNFGGIGVVLGVFIFSLIADTLGRKICFYSALLSVVLFTLLQIPSSSNYNLFALFTVLRSMGLLPIFDVAYNLMCELCPSQSREFIIGIASLGYSIGEMVMPLLGWYFTSWTQIKIASVAPLFIFFVSWKLIPESPRWLVCKSRTKEAAAILTKIATSNGVDTPDDLEARLEILAKRQGSTSIYGFLSLFSSPILLLRTIMLAVGLTASLSAFYQIFHIISTMTHQRHLNFFILALISLPGRVFGVILAVAAGRRWTHSGLLIFKAVLFFVIMLVVPRHWNLGVHIEQALCSLVKTNTEALWIVAYLQAVELFPTVVRMSGLGLCHLVSQAFSHTVPYVIATGRFNLMYPPLIAMIVCLVGAAATSFLPETLQARLPDSLEDSNLFGLLDKYLSFKPSRQGN